MSHNLGPVSALLIVLIITTIAFLDDQAYKVDADAAERSRTLVAHTQELLSSLKDAETGTRGFLLTGDSRYLEPYQAALPRIRQLLGENPGLKSLVDLKLAELADAIEARRSGGEAAATAVVSSGREKQTMDQIRTAVARIVDAENREFHSRARQAGEHADWNRAIFVLGGVALAALLLVSSRHVNRLIGDLSRSREHEAQAKATFQTTLCSIGDAVIATDHTGTIRFMNPVAEALTGWAAADAAGHRLPDVFRIVNETTRRVVENPADQVLREGAVVGLANHTILLARDGREIPIDDSGAPIQSDVGATTGVVLVFRDVTQRRRAQQALEESERQYRLLFDSNPEAMWVYDTNTLRFLLVNKAAVERYGYTREEFLAMTLRDIRPPEDVALLEADVRKDETRLHTDGPWRHRKKDGSIVYAEITAHPIQLGGMSGKLVMARDITDRRRLEEQLRQSQKLEAIGQLAGGIAHDFNNLLTVIEGYAELIHIDQTLHSPLRHSAHEILVASQRAASLTQQLLAFSRRQVVQTQRMNLNPSISQTRRMLARLLGEDISIVTALDPDLADIHADPGQIDQIIINLAVNARDAMDRGGTLTIETANVNFTADEAKRHVGLSAGRYVRLAISDTGHGMDEATRGRIFEPFFTTKPPGRGTGLGLSTVYGIVKQSGGAIETYSEPGKGTTFKIYLAALSGGEAKAEPVALAYPVGRAGETVLVVEDDETVRAIVIAMLAALGYSVLKAETPDDALRLCADPSVRIDLLLTDMVLPHTEGTAIAQQARLHRPDLKVLLMSGYTEHAVLRRHALDQHTPFLQKPFTQAVLARKVRETLESGSGAAG